MEISQVPRLKIPMLRNLSRLIFGLYVQNPDAAAAKWLAMRWLDFLGTRAFNALPLTVLMPVFEAFAGGAMLLQRLVDKPVAIDEVDIDVSDLVAFDLYDSIEMMQFGIGSVVERVVKAAAEAVQEAVSDVLSVLLPLGLFGALAIAFVSRKKR